MRRFLLLALWLAAAAAMLLSPAFAARIVAVGDLHGDYEAYSAILMDAGLIDARGKWAGGNAVLVQTGDVPDRGPDTKKIIEHLMKLEKAARKKGGVVIALIGNHEAMNVTGDLRYVTPEEYAAFRTGKSKRLRDRYFAEHIGALRARYGAELDDDAVRAKFEADAPLGYIEHRLAWAPTGKVGVWVASHDAVVKIGDTVFAHGGISDPWAAKSIAATNAEIRAALKGEGPSGVLEDENGPLWYRGNTEETPAAASEAARVLAVLGARRLVIGHTPTTRGIRALHEARVIMIDTGASASNGGVRSWLEITDDAITAYNAGVATPISKGPSTP
jgi:hypothetical protein